MELKLIGPHPFAVDAQGQPATRIGTVFPEHGVLYTQAPGVHAWQRLAFLDLLNAERARQGQPPLTPLAEEEICSNSADLIFDPNQILIRPNPERMDLAFAADEVLHSLVSKRQIVFLSVSDPRVQDAIKQRGECWRMSSLPATREDKKKMVFGSKVGIGGLPIYFYNRLTGTRWLTYAEFEKLGQLDAAGLAAHLQEIADHCISRNRLDRPEVGFFAADLRHFGPRVFAGAGYDQLSPAELRARFETIRAHFHSAVHEAFRRDDCENKAWCERIMATLFLDGNEAQTEYPLTGLSPEFHMHVEWLPGGRIEDGEFMFDPVFEEAAAHPEDAELQRLCDPRAKGIIFNLIRDYGDLDYINVGRVPESLSIDRPQTLGRRGVYLAELKTRSEPRPMKRFIRLQKWGAWEHLDEGKDLLRSIEESDDYTDFWLDRRLGCRQLLMNLPCRVVMRRLVECYQGKQMTYQGREIHSTYFERDYLDGIATDKLPLERYARPGYSVKLAQMLGAAAASSIIVGRSLEQGTHPVFDDGDEVVREGEDGLPAELMLGDHSGAFGEYRLPLDTFAPHYARPVNTRDKVLPNPREFGLHYLAAFRAQFGHIQGDYRKRRRAFDTLFKHCRYDRGGSFAYRWECVLRRLDETDADALTAAIRREIWVLNLGQEKAAAA